MATKVSPLVSNSLKIFLLSKGWIQNDFHSHEEALTISQRVWNIDFKQVIFMFWSPLFDVNWEQLDVVPIWVHLLCFPPNLWKPQIFQDVGNNLGSYLDADFSYLQTKDKSMARVLVNIDLREGLSEYLDMEEGIISLQPLDYEGVPFRCRRCRKYGHTMKFCNFPLKKKKSLKDPSHNQSSTQHPFIPQFSQSTLLLPFFPGTSYQSNNLSSKSI